MADMTYISDRASLHERVVQDLKTRFSIKVPKMKKQSSTKSEVSDSQRFIFQMQSCVSLAGRSFETQYMVCGNTSWVKHPVVRVSPTVVTFSVGSHHL